MMRLRTKLPFLGSLALLAGCTGTYGPTYPQTYPQAAYPPAGGYPAQPGPAAVPPQASQGVPPSSYGGNTGYRAAYQPSYGSAGLFGSLFDSVIPQPRLSPERYAHTWYYCHVAERQAKVMQCEHQSDPTHDPSCLSALGATPEAAPDYVPAEPMLGYKSMHDTLCKSYIMNGPPPPGY